MTTLPRENSSTPLVVLTIAGSDCSGGAGLQADLKTFSNLGVYGASVVTVVTAQNTCGVRDIHSLPADLVGAQISSVAEDLDVAALKTGLLGDVNSIQAVVHGVKQHQLGPLVVDPVMVASSGDVLLSDDAIYVLRCELIPLATLITPNLAEAAVLLGTPNARAATLNEMEQQARALHALGCTAVLVKGGHGSGDQAVDVLFDGETIQHFTAQWIETQNTHGTGCSLSAAIASNLALGEDLSAAITHAKAYVWQGLVAGRDQQIGKCNGPVDHVRNNA